jgi:antitoxin VapB
MEIAKIFQTGRSQAVRLPKAFRFNTREVVIKNFGQGGIVAAFR